jgi:hypothetical protein
MGRSGTSAARGYRPGSASPPPARYSLRVRLRAPELLALFLIGAAGGLVGDAAHVQTGTTVYLDSTVPFIWESALWFPIAVGLATAVAGELRLRLAPPRPGFDARLGIAAIAAVLALYALTALVSDEPEGPATTLVLMLAVLVAAWLGGGTAALICALTAAVLGPAAEIAVVELEWARYAATANGLFGVAVWLPALYFAFGYVAARLAELAVARRTE